MWKNRIFLNLIKFQYCNKIMIQILTCFSYTRNHKYIFDEENIKTDLKRMLMFSITNLNCRMENIFVLTDLVPDTEKMDEMCIDFETEVLMYLKNKGFEDIDCGSYQEFKDKQLGDQGGNHVYRPLNWLWNICLQLSDTRVQPMELYREVMDNIIPVINNSNVIEFCSLFVNFINVDGARHYLDILSNIFERDKRIFFYYSGHCIRSCTFTDIYMVIPTAGYEVEHLNRDQLQPIFNGMENQEDEETESNRRCKQIFCVFDCCYAESLIKMPYRITFDTQPGKRVTMRRKKLLQRDLDNYIIVITSTFRDQKCGFLDEDKGSIFTFYVIRCLRKISNMCKSKNKTPEVKNLGDNPLDFTVLYEMVERNICKYREKFGKSAQNMCILVSHSNLHHIPTWIYN